VQPNFLIVMVDQLNGTFFPDGPAPFLKVPTLSSLAERSVRFNANYCASPLCAPSRGAFVSGQLPSHSGIFDNAAEFPSSLPTFAHHLRRLGYRTTLCGKSHFVGPDQLHGFEERLTTDIYPADFGWTPDWTKPGERVDWWYHNLSSVTAAGVAEMTNQLEYDDEVTHFARQRIFDFARKGDGRPFCMMVGFTHPHDPYVMRRKYFDLYQDADIPMPGAAIPYEGQDPHSQRILDSCDFRRFEVTEDHIHAARHAYFAAISYVDDRIADVLAAIDVCGFAENTVVIFTSDHGDMLGERGLWFKMNFFEGSARVPLMISAPARMAHAGGACRRVDFRNPGAGRRPEPRAARFRIHRIGSYRRRRVCRGSLDRADRHAARRAFQVHLLGAGPAAPLQRRHRSRRAQQPRR
jgi:choline-sulfatase